MSQIDRYDAAGAMGLVLLVVAIWAIWGWIPVAMLIGLLLIAYAYIGADNRGKGKKQ